MNRMKSDRKNKIDIYIGNILWISNNKRWNSIRCNMEEKKQTAATAAPTQLSNNLMEKVLAHERCFMNYENHNTQVCHTYIHTYISKG